MDVNSLLGAGFLVTIVAALWSRIKSACAVAMSRVIVRLTVEDHASVALRYYAWKHFTRSRLGGARRYTSLTDFVRPLGRREHIAFEDVGKEPLLFWRGWCPLALTYGELRGDRANTISNDYPISVTFLRGTFDADALVQTAMEEYNASLHSPRNRSEGMRFKIEQVSGYRNMARKGAMRDGNMPAESSRGEMQAAGCRPLRWQLQDIGQPLPEGDPFSAISLTPEAVALREDVGRWLASELWYKAKRIPWRMGALLHGKPGTGKSVFVRALGQELDLPIFVFDLGSMTNSDLDQKWSELLSSTPCIVLFEDIDAVYHGRENVTDGEQGNGVTFDHFLNCLSGVGDSSGIFAVVTTNRLDLLDEALGVPDKDRGGLSTRPGRIDRVVEMTILSAEGRLQIAHRILADCPEGTIPEAVAAGIHDTGAQFEQRCSRIALDDYWSQQSTTVA
jgi:hypothetical protein